MFSGLKVRSIVATERSGITSGVPSGSCRPVAIFRLAMSSGMVRLARGICVVTS
jgi:hypothetical protein